MDFVGHGGDQRRRKSPRRARGLLMQLDEGELRSPVDGDEQIELTLCGPDLGDVDVEVADRIDLELALVGSLPFHLGSLRDAVTLQAAMQRERVRCGMVG